jgi:hypothetical protein
MGSRSITIVVFVLLTLCRIPAASAQPRWGRERLPEAGACFFEDSNFRGRYFCVRPGDREPEVPRGMNDRISSIRLLGGAADVTLFRDSGFRGPSIRFTGNVRDLRREGWNDQISSIVVGQGAFGRRGDRGPVWGREAPPRQGACFYENEDFRGAYFCMPRGTSYASLPGGFNDRISSIRVFGAHVRIFRDRDFRGRSTDVRRDVRDFRGSWRDSISSIRVN